MPVCLGLSAIFTSEFVFLLIYTLGRLRHLGPCHPWETYIESLDPGFFLLVEATGE